MKRTLFTRRTSFECLEDRQVMAGNVLAGILAGNLVIAGDNSANAITVAAGATPGQVVVTGVNDASGLATRVNGSSNGAITLNGFNGRIDFLMNGGDDNVSLDGLTSKGTLLDLGRGNDVFSLINHTVNGDLTVKGSDGNEDGVITDFNVTGSFRVDLGEGINKLRSEHGSVGRDAKFLAGRSADQILFQLTSVTGNLSVNLGDGANQFFCPGVSPNRVELKGGRDSDFFQMEAFLANWLTADLGQGDNTLNLFAPNISHDLRITGGSGIDLIRCDEGSVDGNVCIDLGEGNNDLRFYLGVAGDVAIRTGRGTDTALLEGQFSSKPVVYWSLKVDLGDGVNSLTANEISTRGKAEVRGGKNNDTVNWTTAALDSLFADLGAGTNTFNLTSGTVSRSAELKFGGGNDAVNLNDSTLNGNLKVSLGNGQNGLNIQRVSIAGDVQLVGGKDADTFSINNLGLWPTYKSLSVDLGDGANTFTSTFVNVTRKTEIKGGNGFDNISISAARLATLNVTVAKGDDTVIVADVQTSQKAYFDGGPGTDSFFTGNGTPTTFASLERKSFEVIGISS